MTLQYKHNICTLLRNIKFICTRLKTEVKRSEAILPVSKAGTNELYIMSCLVFEFHCMNRKDNNLFKFRISKD